MNKLNRFLLMLIAMVGIMLIAVGIDRGIKYYEQKKWDSERAVIYEESKAEIAQLQTTIQTLSQDQEALLAFMEENELNYIQADETQNSVPENEDFSVSENDISGNFVPDETVSANEIFIDTVSGNTVSGNTVSGNTVSGNTVSENTVSGNTVSGNTVSGNSVSGNSVSGNSISGNRILDNSSEIRKICASYEETIKINHQDKQIIADSDIDFSDKKITCIGDSITEATNLDELENYQQMSYPYQMGQILGAKEVVNLGIGGSSVGRYWDKAFVDRYQEIPEDTDIIIVMGGTNDGFCASEKELGSLEERDPRTFAGDLDELLQKLKTDYPDTQIILATPLSNVLHDMLRKDRDYLLPQSVFAEMIKQLAAEYEIPVVDLYNSNFLNSHDAAVIFNFMPDGVHGNEKGYRMLAEHFAAELIKVVEAEEATGTEETTVDSEGADADE